MKTRLLVKVMAASLLAVGAALILWACQKEKYPDDTIDVQIAKSAEMENYIVAGYELQVALVEFQKAMNAIDWSQMYYVKDEDGHEVMHLPVQSLIFEAKLNQFNDKKDILQRKYRRLTSYSQEKCEDMIRYCLDNSVAVSTKLLDLGINISLPVTKQYMPEPFNNFELIDSLTNWTHNPNYVEAVTLTFADSTSLILIDPRNTSRHGIIPSLFEANDGKTYYPPAGFSNPVIRVGHTHQNSAKPSSADSTVNYQGVERAIFFNGTFHKY